MISPLADNPGSIAVETAARNTNSVGNQIGHVIAGAAIEGGHYLATVERSGELRVFQTTAGLEGGLSCIELNFENENDEPSLKLCKQTHASSNSIQFRRIFVDEEEDTVQGFQIFAIDGEGNILIRTYTSQMNGLVPID